MDVPVRALRDDEREAAWRLNQQAFGGGQADAEPWMAAVVPSRTMVVEAPEGGGLAATAGRWQLGQFFGGRSVPMAGVAGVAVAPEHRGRGYASALMQSMLPAMRADGEVIATLSPATTRLYRGLGWEVAGYQGISCIRTDALSRLPPGAATVRRAGLADLPAIQACYAAVAAEVDGHVDRSDHYWHTTLAAVWDQREVYVVDADDGGLDGYLVYGREPAAMGYTIYVRDVAARHGDALTALWRVVGTSATQARETWWHGTPEDPLLMLLPEQQVGSRMGLRWMLRLVDVAGAVAARGFPAGVEVAADLEVRDRLCPWNEGRWHLTVSGGRGRLEPARGGGGGSGGAVSVGIGALSSLWAGYAVPSALARVGLLSGGSPSDRAALATAFRGPTPWMPDHF
jgi:predicted acetyltransferase